MKNEKHSFLLDFIHGTDKILLSICVLISGFSCLILYSIYSNGFGQRRIVLMQTICFGIGLIAALVISYLDYHFVAKFWPLLAAGALFLVLLTFTPLGYTPPGSDDQAWIRVGSFSFQPSELLKLAFLYTFSFHLSKVKAHMNTFKTFILLCAHGAVPVLLIMVQGDYGSALVFLVVFIAMLFAAGLSWRLILLGVMAAAIATPFIWQLLPDYLQDRFFIAWHPETDPLGDGYQQYKGQVSLGSGQLFGRGLFSEHLLEVPEGYNDFIFSYIGQVLGFVGCLFTLLLLAVLCIKILWIGKRAKDPMGLFLCIGVFAMIAFQATVNIGMVLCVIPVIGITLPFVSYGGTSLVISYMAIGTVLSVYRQSKIQRFFE